MAVLVGGGVGDGAARGVDGAGERVQAVAVAAHREGAAGCGARGGSAKRRAGRDAREGRLESEALEGSEVVLDAIGCAALARVENVAQLLREGQ